MSRIVLATQSPKLHERLYYATGGAFLAIPTAPLTSDAQEFLARLNGAPEPDVLVLDAGDSSDHALELAWALRQARPGIAVILVSAHASEIGLAALRAGVADILHPAADVPVIQGALDRASELSRTASSVLQTDDNLDGGGSGRLISVFSPKGGVGKTTVATNLAIGLAQAAPQSTVLVDLDIQFGDVASALDLEPEFTLPDVVHGPGLADTIALKSFLSLHSSGLYVICGSESPAAADNVTAEEVGQLLRTLAAEFRFVVVDTSPGLTEHNLAVMDETTDVVLVTSMDVPGVRGMRKEMDTLDRLNMASGSRHLVVNLAEKGLGIDIADVEATLGTSVDVEVPRSKAVPISINQGVPLLLSAQRDLAAKQLTSLVERFVPKPQPTPRRRHALIGSSR